MSDVCRNSAEVLRQRGNAAYTAAEHNAAETFYTQAIAGSRSSGRSPSEGLAKLYNNRRDQLLGVEPHDLICPIDGTQCLQGGGAAAAAELLWRAGRRGARAELALKLSPSWCKAAFRMAAALRGLGRLPAALEAARAALMLEPGNPEAKQLIEQLQLQMAAAQNNAQTSTGSHARPPITAAMLPPALRLFEYTPSQDGVDENLLILLHGLGDRPAAFMRLGRTLALPQTALLALGGPRKVPLTDGGRTWFKAVDDELNLIAGVPGEQRRLHSLNTTIAELLRLLQAVESICGWAPRRVHLLGFSQGGTVALELARRCLTAGTPLASCVAISAGFLEETLADSNTAAANALAEGGVSREGGGTSILITHGSADEVVACRTVEATAEALRHQGLHVSVHSMPGKGHTMVNSPREAEALMRFWSKQLRSRPMEGMDVAGGPDHLVELRPGEVSVRRVSEAVCKVNSHTQEKY